MHTDFNRRRLDEVAHPRAGGVVGHIASGRSDRKTAVGGYLEFYHHAHRAVREEARFRNGGRVVVLRREGERLRGQGGCAVATRGREVVFVPRNQIVGTPADCVARHIDQGRLFGHLRSQSVMKAQGRDAPRAMRGHDGRERGLRAGYVGSALHGNRGLKILRSGQIGTAAENHHQ